MDSGPGGGSVNKGGGWHTGTEYVLVYGSFTERLTKWETDDMSLL